MEIKMQHAINDYRRANNKPIIFVWDGLVSFYCKEHCWAMSRAENIYHAPDYFLHDWGEAVLMCTYSGEDIHSLGKQIMFDMINSSPQHRSIVLDSNELAFGYVISNWKLYLTIRGK